MKIFEYLNCYQYEQVVLGNDSETGLKAVIAIHDTTLGPALGGTRIWPYASEEEAIMDALRLARGMTYKAAAAGLDLGGGKAVIIGSIKTPDLLKAYGRLIDTLGGRYITAEDVGTNQADMDWIRTTTRYVTGISPGLGGSGNPSPFTAFGVFQGILAAAKKLWGTESLENRTVALQGLGSVGYQLGCYLVSAGAKLIITDLAGERIQQGIEEWGAQGVNLDEIYSVKCEIFAPCALGAVINDQTIKQFSCQLIAGAANNVLAEDRHGQILEKKGILYVPDFVINAGGLINVAQELLGYNQQTAWEKVAKIYNHVTEVLQMAESKKIPPCRAAEIIVENRLLETKITRGGN